jgi:type VI secretion system protein ImpG
MTFSGDDLLAEYERELAILRRSLGEFARRHPKAASRLGISGERSEDPQVERLIQSAALTHARVSARINDDYPEMPTSLLEILYPEYLRPVPSCSIAHFGDTSAVEQLTEPVTVKRGAKLKTRQGEYQFRTVYDVVLAPFRIAHARYAPAASIPANVRLDEDTTGIASITFAACGGKAMHPSRATRRVRVYVDGERRTVAAAMDMLLLRTSNAFVEADGSGTWIALDSVPVNYAGFADDEALIQRHDTGRSPFRFLLEYFSYPEKFDFIDVDLSAVLRSVGACASVTLHLPVHNLHRDCAQGRLLQDLTVANFKLFCTPVINLFSTSAEPIPLEGKEFPLYPIAPADTNVKGTSVYRVDTVRLTQDAPQGAVVSAIEPYRSLRHPSLRDDAVYWIAERDGRLAEFMPGQGMLLSLVDLSGEITDVTGTRVDIDMACVNGNSPAALSVGRPKGDFIHAGETLTGRVWMLHAPTESATRAMAHDRLWDIVAMLSAGALTMCQSGLPAFKQLLQAHVSSHATNATRHIDGLMSLTREAALEWIVMEPQPALVRGLRVCVAVDETKLVDCAVSVLARVLESLFVHHAPASNFVQLRLLSAQNGFELFLGRPLPGAEVLI